MSQKKTKIQGLEPEEQNYGGAYTPNQSFYTQSAPASKPKGTIVPGMAQPTDMSVGNSQGQMPGHYIQRQDGKPVVGFLYSVSRTAMGEYWPLYVGRNTIGQKSECDIPLLEATVSGEHAVIVVRMKKPSGEIIAAIKDTESSNGTLLNGMSIDFDAVECHSGDVITVGNNYELVLVLVDTAKLRLKTSTAFIPVESADSVENPMQSNYMQSNPSMQSDPSKRGTKPGGFSPFQDGPTSWGGFRPTDGTSDGFSPSDGTVGMDGVSGGQHGGTIPMP